MRRNWDAHWRERAYLNASMSTCIRRHVGAVAVINRRSFADAFNGNIPGAPHCDEGGCPRCNAAVVLPGELDLCLCVHAEANLITFCAASGIVLAGATVYCTTRPCADCFKLLIGAQVREIVYDEEYPLPDGFLEMIKGLISVRTYDG